MFQMGRAWIEIDEKALINNAEQFQALLPDGCRLMPAVKANAYGHGAVRVSRILQSIGIDDFCVASAEEGIELREAGIKGQILVLGYTHPRLFPELEHYELTQTVVDSAYAEKMSRYSGELNAHIGVDTGMRRLGERSESTENIIKMCNIPNIHVTGAFSHLCVSDGTSAAERAFTLEQISRYDELISALHKNGVNGFQTHLQGSYGVLNYPELKYDLARVGIALYGVYSSPGDAERVKAHIDLRPVLTLKSRIECVRELDLGEALGYGLTFTAGRKTRAATVSIGYADGVPRGLSNTGEVLVNGRRTPIIGRVCMDQLSIDVTDISSAAPGDEVVLIGASGDEKISAEEFAAAAGTISNEVLSRMGLRLYMNEQLTAV